MEKVRGFWPGYHLAKMEGHLFRNAGDQLNVSNTERIARYTAAVESYREVLAMQPYEAGAAVNLANTLSLLGRDEEAEEAFAVAIRLAGDLESGFQARFWYANHLHIYWRQQWHERRPEEALWGFLKARRLMDEVAKMSPPWENTQTRRALIKSLDESITFLQGAGIEPRDPALPPDPME
jgi:tetratricopeptide (TPR) repeat protein